MTWGMKNCVKLVLGTSISNYTMLGGDFRGYNLIKDGETEWPTKQEVFGFLLIGRV